MPRIHCDFKTNLCEQEINMALEIESMNEELTATKGRETAASEGKDRGRARKWMAPEIDQQIDLLEEKDCLWDVNKNTSCETNVKELSKR